MVAQYSMETNSLDVAGSTLIQSQRNTEQEQIYIQFQSSIDAKQGRIRT